MKNAIILQGAGETTESFWLPWLKNELDKKGYEVWLQQLPDNDDPQLEKNLPFVLDNGKFTEETIIISHSAGCPLTLSVLENLNVQIKQAILVAGYCSPLPGKDAANKILQESYDWDKIKKNVKDIIFMNSINDPWGCDDRQGRKMFDNLGGTLITNNEGHMGSDSFNQPYKEFPFLLRMVE